MPLFNILVIVALALWILLAVALILSLLYALPAIRGVRDTTARYRRLADDLQANADPLLERATSVAENADYITASMRADVQAVGRTVDRATESVDRIVGGLEDRAAELNGLLAVMQEEAEDAFLSTASLLRGLTGSRRDDGRRGRRGRRGRQKAGERLERERRRVEAR